MIHEHKSSGKMSTKLLAVFVVLLCVPSVVGADEVRAQIKWKYKNFPAEMKTYEVAEGQKPRMWTTKTVTSIKDAPVGSQISGSSLILDKGSQKRFILVAHNTTDKPIYFFAAPHGVEPVENALGFKFKCLCINFAYEIGPGEVWYRVVILKVSPDFYGDAMTLTHNLVGIDQKRFSKFSLVRNKRRPGF